MNETPNKQRPLLIWLSRHKPAKANIPDLIGYDVVQVSFRYTSWQQAYQDIVFASNGRWPAVIAYVISEELEKGFIRFIKAHMPNVILLRMWTENGEDPNQVSGAKVWFVKTTLEDNRRIMRQREMFDLQSHLKSSHAEGK